MKTYSKSHSTSRWADPHYLLTYCAERVAEDPAVLEPLTKRVFRVVFAGGHLDFGAAWDRLFMAGVQGGLEHLDCQERIGRAVATCRREAVVAA